MSGDKVKISSIFLSFLGIWFVLNIATAFSTDLYADEAYYWMYSNFLDWGYYDHPPGIAIEIYLSKFLGKNELAVRLINVLMVMASLFLMYRLVRPKQALLFAAVLFSSPLLHIIGFITVPDGLLLFFSLLFLISFRSLAEKKTLTWAILTGISAALMIYSKYHGFLVVLFSVMAVPRLLKDYKLYVSGIVTLILISPHLFWQWQHEFPSIKYHLVDRLNSGFDILNTLGFLLFNIFFLFGVVSLILLYFLVKNPVRSTWQNILRFNFFGTYIFFLLMTFRGQVIEANWTLTALFPLLYLGYKALENSTKQEKFSLVVMLSIPLMILIRVHIFTPLFQIPGDKVSEVHGNRFFVEKVVTLASNDLVMANRYQEASIINFYGDLGYQVPSLNICSRPNQYDLWQFERQYREEQPDILYLANHLCEGSYFVHDGTDTVRYRRIEKTFLPNCIDYKLSSFSIEDNHGILEIELDRSLDYEEQADLCVRLDLVYENKINHSRILEFKDAELHDNLATWEFTLDIPGNDNARASLLLKRFMGERSSAIHSFADYCCCRSGNFAISE